MHFSPIVAERIGWYVYVLVDPRDERVFYIGKGTENRVFSHAEAALALDDEDRVTAKLDRIRAIHDAGLTVGCFILRHGIATERQAYDIEAAAIDLLRLLSGPGTAPQARLTNVVRGHRHAQYGLAHVDVVASLYDVLPAPPFTEPMLLLRIPGLWTPQMTADQLYEATHGWWVIGERRRKSVRFACAVSRGVIRAVYRIESWRAHMDGDRGWEPARRRRWGFEGFRDSELEARYVNTSVAEYFKPGEANPVKLVTASPKL